MKARHLCVLLSFISLIFIFIDHLHLVGYTFFHLSQFLSSLKKRFKS